MLNFFEFRINEAEDNPKLTQMEDSIKEKLADLPEVKKRAKEGKQGNEAKIASLVAQAKAYSEISNLMTALSREISANKTSKEGTTNIY